MSPPSPNRAVEPAPRAGIAPQPDDVRVRLAWEHTHREMLPALLLLHRLEREGIRWALEHITALTAGEKGREVVFLPFYYDDHDFDRYLFRGRWQERCLVNLAFEQMRLRCGYSYQLPDGSLGRGHMLHCAWGERYRAMLLAHGVAADRIRVTGHPRLDLYHHPELLLDRAALAARFSLQPDRPWVLVPYNFNLAFVNGAYVRQLQRRKYFITEEHVAETERARRAFTGMVRRLCDALPEAEIVLRVHPAGYEAEALYREEPNGRPNLKLAAQFDVASWVAQAALVIVWTSTTAMEAVAARRPVVAFDPHGYGERFEYDVNRIVPTCRGVDDIVDMARSPERTPPPDRDLFAAWYGETDGGATERLLSLVRETCGSWDTVRCRLPAGGSWRGQVRRRVEGATARVTALRPAVRALLGLGSRARAEPPPADALARAVTTLSPAPLERFLR